MATDDEVRRLILEVIGEDKVRQLREQIDQEKESLLKLTSTLAHLAPEEIARDKGVQLATQHLTEMNSELRRLEGSHRNLGYAALEASRAFEDLQYGIGGVINNIPGLVMALGGGAGVTAAISALAVVGNQLVKHFFPDWEGGVAKVKDKHHQLTAEMQEQIKAIKALQEAETQADQERKKSRGGAAEEVIAAHREEIRSALGGQMTGDIQADIERLTAREAAIGAGPVVAGTGEELWHVRRNLARARRRLPGVQREADIMIGRAIAGGVPELRRLQGLFGADTDIGAGLNEASPERVEQRRQEEQDVARQRRAFKIAEADQKRREAAVSEDVASMGVEGEEQRDRARVIHQEVQADRKAARHARTEAARQAKHDAAQAKSAAAHARTEAAKEEREFLENLRLQVDVAASRGVSAQAIGMQANAMFQKMAMQNGQTTNLAQAQVRMMLHLQQLYQHQQHQQQEVQRNVQQFWNNASRTGK